MAAPPVTATAVDDALPAPHPEGVGPGGEVRGGETALWPGSDRPSLVLADCAVYAETVAGEARDVVVRSGEALTAEGRARSAEPLGRCPEPQGELVPMATEAGAAVGGFRGRSTAGGPYLFAVQPAPGGGLLTVFDETAARPVYADAYRDGATEPTVTASDVLVYDRALPDADFKCPDEIEAPVVVQRVELALPSLTIAEGALRCVAA